MDKQRMKRMAGLGLAVALAGCAGAFWNRDEAVRVDDAGVAINCPASGPEAWIREFPSLDAVRSWETDNGVELLTPGAEPGRYAIVGMGQRNTGGYGIAVSREAALSDGTLRLKATFVSPGAGAMTVQMLTSPCALVRLPAAAWHTIEVYDQTGRLRVQQASPT